MKKNEPKIMIILDTGRLGGPGKGLLQFLGIAKGLHYGLYCFKYGTGRNCEFAEEAKKRGIKIRFFNQIFRFDPRPIARAFIAVKHENYNIIQTHGYKADVLGFFLKLFNKLQWISFSHGFTSENLKVKLYNRLDRILLRRADIIIAVSESIKRILVQSKVQEEKIRVSCNAIDHSDFAHGNGYTNVLKPYKLNPDWPLIGVIGRLSHEKGQIQFLKACKMSLDKGIVFQAVIIGDGQDRGRLNEYISKNRLNNYIRLVGYQNDIVSWYRALDLLVLPSLSEGLPNVVLEAMFFNVPVIATDVGGVSNIINCENGVLIPPSRPDIMAKEMIKLVTDKDRRQEIAQKGRQTLFPKFSPEKRSKAILSVYKELLDR